MPEETNATPEGPANETPQEPKVRRISNKNPRKTAKDAEKASAAKDNTGEPISETARKPKAAPKESPTQDIEDAKPAQKRSNRRRRGKGNSTQDDSDQAKGDDSSGEPSATTPEAGDDNGEKPKARDQRPTQKPRRKLDPEKVGKNAWKIYLAEVSEEGVALIGDNDARELARRCFRLSEIFLEEENRHN